MRWASILAVGRTTHAELRDSWTVESSRTSVSVLRFVMLAWRGIHQSLVWRNLHPLRTSDLDTVIFAVRPSKMLTSSLSQMETYPVSANLPPLRRDWLANEGTMSTVHTGSQTFCYRLVKVVAGVGWPSARVNIFDDFTTSG